MLVRLKALQTFLLFICVILVFIPNESLARELYSRHTSVRALGMGGAFIPLARGADALYFNPAGLARTTEVTLTPLKLRAGVNGVDAYEDAEDFDSDNFADTLRNFYGDTLWLGGGATVGLSMPYFAAAIYDSFNVSADLSNPALPSFEVDFVNDYGIATGFGIDVFPGFSLGIVGKRIDRRGASLEIPVSSIANLSNEDLKDELNNRGIGYAFDFGAMLTLPFSVNPAISLVMKDIGDTSFSLKSGIRNPPTDYSELMGAFSFEVEIPGITISPVFEMRHLTDNEVHIGKKIHMGVEVDLPGIDLRVGLHQGYYTAGLGLNLGIIMLDFATYGVEMGEYPGQHEDRRYMFEMTIDFGYDTASGSFLGLTKENRNKLKQRR